MTFNINDFRSQLQFDGARPNLFQVTLPFPTFVVGGGAASVKTSFMARSSTLPGSSVSAISLPYFGREVKVPGNRSFDDWSITVINDEDFIIRNAFENWLNNFNAHVANVRNPAALSSYQYSVNSQILQYGKTGNVIKKYDFVGMFPTNISSIEVSWSDNDTVEEFGVTFSYQYWTVDGVTDIG